MPLFSVASVIVPSLFLILFFGSYSLFFLVILTRSLSILQTFSKNQTWALQIIAYLFSIMLMSGVTPLIAYHLFPWALFCWVFPLTS